MNQTEQAIYLISRILRIPYPKRIKTGKRISFLGIQVSTILNHRHGLNELVDFQHMLIRSVVVSAAARRSQMLLQTFDRVSKNTPRPGIFAADYVKFLWQEGFLYCPDARKPGTRCEFGCCGDVARAEVIITQMSLFSPVSEDPDCGVCFVV